MSPRPAAHTQEAPPSPRHGLPPPPPPTASFTALALDPVLNLPLHFYYHNKTLTKTETLAILSPDDSVAGGTSAWTHSVCFSCFHSCRFFLWCPFSEYESLARGGKRSVQSPSPSRTLAKEASQHKKKRDMQRATTITLLTFRNFSGD